jgi:microsomal dipeptidase-like Zn-dependent dipeptidase
MRPQEKAEELVLKYLRIENNTLEWFNKHIAKQCAIIAVDEIILAIDFDWMQIQNLEEEHRYWDRVKTEIGKL